MIMATTVHGQAKKKRPKSYPLKQVHADMGWRLLMNEHVPLEKERRSRLPSLGIENWSAKANFTRYGKMADAYAGCRKISL